MIKNFTLFCVLTCFSYFISAQEKDSINKMPAISIAVQPFYLVQNIMKVDMELYTSGRFSYIISPEIYYGKAIDKTGKSSINDIPHDKLRGLGIGAYQKFTFTYKSKNSPYFAYCLPN